MFELKLAFPCQSESPRPSLWGWGWGWVMEEPQNESLSECPEKLVGLEFLKSNLIFHPKWQTNYFTSPTLPNV